MGTYADVNNAEIQRGRTVFIQGLQRSASLLLITVRACICSSHSSASVLHPQAPDLSFPFLCLSKVGKN